MNIEMFLQKKKKKNIEILLSFVSEHPELYDKSHIEYKNPDKREALWEEIAEEMGTDADEVKRKWKNLRDTYTRRKRENSECRSGQDAKHRKPWKYMKVMEFLAAFTETKSVHCKIEERDDSGSEEATSSSGASTRSLETPSFPILSVTPSCPVLSATPSCPVLSATPSCPVLSATPSCPVLSVTPSCPVLSATPSCPVLSATPSCPVLSATPSCPVLSVTPSCPVLSAHKKRKQPETLDLLERYLENKQQRDRERQDQRDLRRDDDIGLFMQSLVPVIRRLSPDTRSSLKFQIHTLVHEAECRERDMRASSQQLSMSYNSSPPQTPPQYTVKSESCSP